MSTQKNANETATKKVVKINLEKFASEIKKKAELLKSVSSEKQYLYKYPAQWDKETIQSRLGKQFRTKCRKSIERFSNNIFCYADMNETEKLINEISNFKIFYKENFLINDFSVESISNSETNKKSIKLMLDIISEVEKQTK